MFGSETITFMDVNGTFLLTLHLNMESSLRNTLLPCYQASLPGHLQYANTGASETACSSLGQAIHFDWYNQYCTLVSFISILVFFGCTKENREREHQQIFTQTGFKSMGKKSGHQLQQEKPHPTSPKS